MRLVPACREMLPQTCFVARGRIAPTGTAKRVLVFARAARWSTLSQPQSPMDTHCKQDEHSIRQDLLGMCFTVQAGVSRNRLLLLDHCLDGPRIEAIAFRRQCHVDFSFGRDGV